MASNRAIGHKHSLPWDFKEYPSDLVHFRELTKGSKLVVGANTFKGFSEKSIASIIKDRTIYILTRDPSWLINETGIKRLAWGVRIFDITDIDQVPEDAWICGGAKIYKELLPACDELFLTYIYKDYPADTFFPNFEEDFHLKDKNVSMYGGLEFRRYINKYL